VNEIFCGFLSRGVKWMTKLQVFARGCVLTKFFVGFIKGGIIDDEIIGFC